MKVLVIIPAYNEEECIENTVNKLKKINSKVDYVVINDCSKDSTKDVCEKNKFNVFYVLNDEMKLLYEIREDEIFEIIKEYGNITLEEYYRKLKEK